MALLTVTHDLAFAEHWADVVWRCCGTVSSPRPYPQRAFLAGRRRRRSGPFCPRALPQRSQANHDLPLAFAREAFAASTMVGPTLITPAARNFEASVEAMAAYLRHSNVQTGGTIRVPRQRRRPR